jgi:hypothetical protein
LRVGRHRCKKTQQHYTTIPQSKDIFVHAEQTGAAIENVKWTGSIRGS